MLPAVDWLLISCQHPVSKNFIPGPLDWGGGDHVHAVGLQQQHRQPLRRGLRLHARVKALLVAGILGLRWDQDGREV